MLKIVQDFKNWVDACVITKNCETYLRNYRESIIAWCDSRTVFENWYKENVYNTALRYAAASDDFKRFYQIRGQKSVTCRASSCFYKLVDETYKGTAINPKDVFECINVKDKEGVGEHRCIGCSHYDEHTRYQLLNSRLQEAQEKQQAAKQKLLDNFRFWKQKGELCK